MSKSGIKWTKHPDREYGPQFDAQVGHLFVRVQDNGEGWFNWTVSISDMGIANEEDGAIEQGGETGQRRAKAAVVLAVRRIIHEMEVDLGLTARAKRRRCEYCKRLTLITTAGCDHCDVEDK